MAEVRGGRQAGVSAQAQRPPHAHFPFVMNCFIHLDDARRRKSAWSPLIYASPLALARACARNVWCLLVGLARSRGEPRDRGSRVSAWDHVTGLACHVIRMFVVEISTEVCGGDIHRGLSDLSDFYSSGR